MIKTMSFAALHFTVAFSVAYLMTGSVLVGGAIALVEPAKLDARRVGNQAGLPAEGIDLAHEVPLAQAAHGRVAGHPRHRRGVQCNQGRGEPQTSGGERRLNPGVARPNDNNVGH